MIEFFIIITSVGFLLGIACVISEIGKIRYDKRKYKAYYERAHGKLLHLHERYEDDTETLACDVARDIAHHIWRG